LPSIPLGVFSLCLCGKKKKEKTSRGNLSCFNHRAREVLKVKNDCVFSKLRNILRIANSSKQFNSLRLCGKKTKRLSVKGQWMNDNPNPSSY
jgi:hypothetical protein